jgi:hypothetical protein
MLAKLGGRSKIPVYDGVCFHCQQCAEKYLKGVIEEVGLSVPKIHDLDLLLTILISRYRTLRSLRRGLVFSLIMPWIRVIQAAALVSVRRLLLFVGLIGFGRQSGSYWAYANAAGRSSRCYSFNSLSKASRRV